jgi:predicted DCC family thiol-disulfide oxidoreductase YuxK
MEQELIIVFDCECNFCDASVRFIITRDKKGKFKFAPAQSKTGIRLQKKHDINAVDQETLILIKDGTAYTKSDAILIIVRNMDGFWKLLTFLKIMPKPIREWLYLKIAKNRYNWFGRRNSCIIPDKNMKSRFLE